MNKTEQVYLLLGPELGKKIAYISDIRSALEGKTGGSLEEHRFYPFESQAVQIISLIKNGSLFAGHKLILIHQAESLSAEDRKKFIEYIKAPSPDSTVIFCSEETRLTPAFEGAFPKNGKTIFWELFENEKRSWILRYFKEAGFSIEPDAVELILDLVENNTLELKKECEKIARMTARKQTIDAEDVETVLFHSKGETVFSLFGKMVEGKLTSSLEALQAIIDSGEGSPIQLTGGLLWQFRRLLDVTSLMANHYSFKDACEKLNIRGKRNQAGYEEGTRRYSTADLQRIVMMIADFDAALRQVRTDMERTLLDLLVYGCVQKKGRLEKIYSDTGETLNRA